MIKGFRQIASITVLSRILGMIRDMAFAHFFGAGWLMNAWTMGFKIPNLARRLFGEGAASASFIPVYSEQLHHNPKDANRLACTVATVIFVVLAAIVVIGQLVIWGWYWLVATNTGPKVGLALCSIMLPYMIFVCVVAILAGILNVHRHFAAPAAAPIVLNIFIISAIAFTGWALKLEASQQVFFVALAVLLAGFAQIAIQLGPLRRHGVILRPAWDTKSQAFKKIIVMMGPMIIGLTATQLNTLADDVIAGTVMYYRPDITGRGAISYLYYAQRLYQFPLGVLGISLATAIFPVMSSDAARKDLHALTKTISRGIRAALFVAIPATAGIFLVAKPLVSAIFEHGRFESSDTPIVAATLSFYAIGLCGYFCQQLTTRAYYSLQDSRTPMVSALIAVVANIILNLTLIWSMGTAGLALATAICSYLQVTILTIGLKKRMHISLFDGIAATLLKSILATALMYAAGAAVLMLMAPLARDKFFNVLRLAAVVPVSAVVYAAAARILRIKELALLTGKKAD